MAKTKAHLTPYELYKKEYKRLQQAIRRQRKKGYDISAEDIAVKTPGQIKSGFGLEYDYLPDIDLLKSFTPEHLRNIAIAKQKAADWGYENEPYPPEDSTLNQAIIDEFERLFMEPGHPRGSPNFAEHKMFLQHELQAMWIDTVDSTDPYELSSLLEANAGAIKETALRLQYESESVQEEQTDLAFLGELLNGGRALTAAQADRISESAMWYNLTDNLRGGL